VNKYLEKIAATRAFKEAFKKLPGKPIPKGQLGPMGRWYNEWLLKDQELKRRAARGPLN
jgi:hypothetical protein